MDLESETIFIDWNIECVVLQLAEHLHYKTISTQIETVSFVKSSSERESLLVCWSKETESAGQCDLVVV